MTATLGKTGRASLAIDLPRLLESRLLVQAGSGGGKSWVLRRLLEQTANQVQQIIIDPEGEFATLREKFDFIIAAAVGMEPTGGTFGTYLGDLRRNGLITERDGVAVANDILFPGGN